MHVLFDEANSLIEHDTRDEEFELDFMRKYLSLTQNSMHEKGKSPENEPSPKADILKGGQGLNQSGGSIAEPKLEQIRSTQPNSLRIDLRTGSRIGLGIGSRTGPESVSSSIPTKAESMSVGSIVP